MGRLSRAANYPPRIAGRPDPGGGVAAVLSGAAVTSQVERGISELAQPPGTGHAFIAIDIGTIMPAAEFKARLDHMIRDLHAAPNRRCV